MRWTAIFQEDKVLDDLLRTAHGQSFTNFWAYQLKKCVLKMCFKNVFHNLFHILDSRLDNVSKGAHPVLIT